MKAHKQLRVGSRVCVLGKPHKGKQRCGLIRAAPRDRVYAIEFDDMPGQIHRWYVAKELKKSR